MNPKQPFYVDVGTSVVAIRCASNHDVIERYDHVRHPHTLKFATDVCDRMNKEVEIHNGGNAAAMHSCLLKILAEMIDLGGIERGKKARFSPDAIAEEIRQALAVPPRNCDMPLVVDGPADNNADKVWLVFKRHNPDAYFDVSGLLRCIDWLLAPAPEKEGGAE